MADVPSNDAEQPTGLPVVGGVVGGTTSGNIKNNMDENTSTTGQTQKPVPSPSMNKLQVIDMTMRTILETKPAESTTAAAILDTLHKCVQEQRLDFLQSVYAVAKDAGYAVDFKQEPGVPPAPAHPFDKGMPPSSTVSIDLGEGMCGKLRYRKGARNVAGFCGYKNLEPWGVRDPLKFSLKVRMEVIGPILQYAVVMDGWRDPFAVCNRTNWNNRTPIEPDKVW